MQSQQKSAFVSSYSVLEVFTVALRLGFISFGGPIAHLSFFREEYVKRKKWLDEAAYADLVALCQLLPGPASSQVGIAIGMIRAGLPGAIASWVGFTLPSAVALMIFAYTLIHTPQLTSIQNGNWIQGLLVMAVAVVAFAVWGMARSLASDRFRATIAFLSAIVAVTWPTAWTHIIIILGSGFIGWLALQNKEVEETSRIPIPISRNAALIAWGLFFSLLLLLPLLRHLTSYKWLALIDSFYRTGSLVFGGGHVVLPLLQAEVVPMGWVAPDQFLAGYGAAQAVPGPLFTFAAYLGTWFNGWSGALLATLVIFLPSFLLVLGTLPFWDWIRSRPSLQAALNGIKAAVVGLLLASLYDPIWTEAIQSPLDFGLALASFTLLAIWKLPPWLIVIFTVIGSLFLSPFVR